MQPDAWAIVVVPVVGGSVQSSHPGLTQEQAYELLLSLITDYRREMGMTKPLVLE